MKIEKTVRLKQGISCDCSTTKHLIREGERFVQLPSGRLSCVAHQYDEPLIETQLAGALR